MTAQIHGMQFPESFHIPHRYYIPGIQNVDLLTILGQFEIFDQIIRHIRTLGHDLLAGIIGTQCITEGALCCRHIGAAIILTG